MKNYRILLYAFSILGLFMTSCDNDDEQLEASSITFLPKITLEGGSKVTLDCEAETYTDPGATAEAGGSQIELETNVTGKYFGGSSVTDGPDVYLVSYSAFNSDGIPATEARQVLYPECNGDLVTSIAGMYTATVARNGNTPSDAYRNNGPFIIRDLGNDRYAISDAHGGWYEYGRGLGLPYATPGMVLVANSIPGNSFTSEGPVSTNTFGGSNSFTSLTVDPVSRTLVLTVEWSFGFTFVTTFTQTDEYFQ